jgi:hypothetical protein
MSADEDSDEGVNFCYNCQEDGHETDVCPILKCKKCGLQGHIFRDCAIPPHTGELVNMSQDEEVDQIAATPAVVDEVVEVEDNDEEGYCVLCQGTDHCSDMCPILICISCNRQGHVKVECPDLVRPSIEQQSLDEDDIAAAPEQDLDTTTDTTTNDDVEVLHEIKIRSDLFEPRPSTSGTANLNRSIEEIAHESGQNHRSVISIPCISSSIEEIAHESGKNPVTKKGKNTSSLPKSYAAKSPPSKSPRSPKKSSRSPSTSSRRRNSPRRARSRSKSRDRQTSKQTRSRSKSKERSSRRPRSKSLDRSLTRSRPRETTSRHTTRSRSKERTSKHTRSRSKERTSRHTRSRSKDRTSRPSTSGGSKTTISGENWPKNSKKNKVRSPSSELNLTSSSSEEESNSRHRTKSKQPTTETTRNGRSSSPSPPPSVVRRQYPSLTPPLPPPSHQKPPELPQTRSFFRPKKSQKPPPTAQTHRRRDDSTPTRDEPPRASTSRLSHNEFLDSLKKMANPIPGPSTMTIPPPNFMAQPPPVLVQSPILYGQPLYQFPMIINPVPQSYDHPAMSPPLSTPTPPPMLPPSTPTTPPATRVVDNFPNPVPIRVSTIIPDSSEVLQRWQQTFVPVKSQATACSAYLQLSYLPHDWTQRIIQDFLKDLGLIEGTHYNVELAKTVKKVEALVHCKYKATAIHMKKKIEASALKPPTLIVVFLHQPFHLPVTLQKLYVFCNLGLTHFNQRGKGTPRNPNFNVVFGSCAVDLMNGTAVSRASFTLQNVTLLYIQGQTDQAKFLANVKENMTFCLKSYSMKNAADKMILQFESWLKAKVFLQWMIHVDAKNKNFLESNVCWVIINQNNSQAELQSKVGQHFDIDMTLVTHRSVVLDDLINYNMAVHTQQQFKKIHRDGKHIEQLFQNVNAELLPCFVLLNVSVKGVELSVQIADNPKTFLMTDNLPPSNDTFQNYVHQHNNVCINKTAIDDTALAQTFPKGLQSFFEYASIMLDSNQADQLVLCTPSTWLVTSGLVEICHNHGFGDKLSSAFVGTCDLTAMIEEDTNASQVHSHAFQIVNPSLVSLSKKFLPKEKQQLSGLKLLIELFASLKEDSSRIIGNSMTAMPKFLESLSQAHMMKVLVAKQIPSTSFVPIKITSESNGFTGTDDLLLLGHLADDLVLVKVTHKQGQYYLEVINIGSDSCNVKKDQIVGVGLQPTPTRNVLSYLLRQESFIDSTKGQYLQKRVKVGNFNNHTITDLSDIHTVCNDKDILDQKYTFYVLSVFVLTSAHGGEEEVGGEVCLADLASGNLVYKHGYCLPTLQSNINEELTKRDNDRLIGKNMIKPLVDFLHHKNAGILAFRAFELTKLLAKFAEACDLSTQLAESIEVVADMRWMFHDTPNVYGMSWANLIGDILQQKDIPESLADKAKLSCNAIQKKLKCMDIKSQQHFARQYFIGFQDMLDVPNPASKIVIIPTPLLARLSGQPVHTEGVFHQQTSAKAIEVQKAVETMERMLEANRNMPDYVNDQFFKDIKQLIEEGKFKQVDKGSVAKLRKAYKQVKARKEQDEKKKQQESKKLAIVFVDLAHFTYNGQHVIKAISLFCPVVNKKLQISAILPPDDLPEIERRNQYKKNFADVWIPKECEVLGTRALPRRDAVENITEFLASLKQHPESFELFVCLLFPGYVYYLEHLLSKIKDHFLGWFDLSTVISKFLYQRDPVFKAPHEDAALLLKAQHHFFGAISVTIQDKTVVMKNVVDYLVHLQYPSYPDFIWTNYAPFVLPHQTNDYLVVYLQADFVIINGEHVITAIATYTPDDGHSSSLIAIKPTTDQVQHFKNSKGFKEMRVNGKPTLAYSFGKQPNTKCKPLREALEFMVKTLSKPVRQFDFNGLILMSLCETGGLPLIIQALIENNVGQEFLKTVHGIGDVASFIQRRNDIQKPLGMQELDDVHQKLIKDPSRTLLKDVNCKTLVKAADFILNKTLPENERHLQGIFAHPRDSAYTNDLLHRSKFITFLDGYFDVCLEEPFDASVPTEEQTFYVSIKGCMFPLTKELNLTIQPANSLPIKFQPFAERVWNSKIFKLRAKTADCVGFWPKGSIIAKACDPTKFMGESLVPKLSAEEVGQGDIMQALDKDIKTPPPVIIPPLPKPGAKKAKKHHEPPKMPPLFAVDPKPLVKEKLCTSQKQPSTTEKSRKRRASKESTEKPKSKRRPPFDYRKHPDFKTELQQFEDELEVFEEFKELIELYVGHCLSNKTPVDKAEAVNIITALDGSGSELSSFAAVNDKLVTEEVLADPKKLKMYINEHQKSLKFLLEKDKVFQKFIDMMSMYVNLKSCISTTRSSTPEQVVQQKQDNSGISKVPPTEVMKLENVTTYAGLKNYNIKHGVVQKVSENSDIEANIPYNKTLITILVESHHVLSNQSFKKDDIVIVVTTANKEQFLLGWNTLTDTALGFVVQPPSENCCFEVGIEENGCVVKKTVKTENIFNYEDYIDVGHKVMLVLDGPEVSMCFIPCNFLLDCVFLVEEWTDFFDNIPRFFPSVTIRRDLKLQSTDSTVAILETKKLDVISEFLAFVDCDTYEILDIPITDDDLLNDVANTCDLRIRLSDVTVMLAGSVDDITDAYAMLYFATATDEDLEDVSTELSTEETSIEVFDEPLVHDEAADNCQMTSISTLEEGEIIDSEAVLTMSQEDEGIIQILDTQEHKQDRVAPEIESADNPLNLGPSPEKNQVENSSTEPIVLQQPTDNPTCPSEQVFSKATTPGSPGQNGVQQQQQKVVSEEKTSNKQVSQELSEISSQEATDMSSLEMEVVIATEVVTLEPPKKSISNTRKATTSNEVVPKKTLTKICGPAAKTSPALQPKVKKGNRVKIIPPPNSNGISTNKEKGLSIKVSTLSMNDPTLEALFILAPRQLLGHGMREIVIGELTGVKGQDLNPSRMSIHKSLFSTKGKMIHGHVLIEQCYQLSKTTLLLVVHVKLQSSPHMVPDSAIAYVDINGLKPPGNQLIDDLTTCKKLCKVAFSQGCLAFGLDEDGQTFAASKNITIDPTRTVNVYTIPPALSNKLALDLKAFIPCRIVVQGNESIAKGIDFILKSLSSVEDYWGVSEKLQELLPVPMDDSSRWIVLDDSEEHKTSDADTPDRSRQKRKKIISSPAYKAGTTDEESLSPPPEDRQRKRQRRSPLTTAHYKQQQSTSRSSRDRTPIAPPSPKPSTSRSVLVESDDSDIEEDFSTTEVSDLCYLDFHSGCKDLKCKKVHVYGSGLCYCETFLKTTHCIASNCRKPHWSFRKLSHEYRQMQSQTTQQHQLVGVPDLSAKLTSRRLPAMDRLPARDRLGERRQGENNGTTLKIKTEPVTDWRQQQQQQEVIPIPCHYYTHGSCKYGQKCGNLHEGSSNQYLTLDDSDDLNEYNNYGLMTGNRSVIKQHLEVHEDYDPPSSPSRQVIEADTLNPELFHERFQVTTLKEVDRRDMDRPIHCIVNCDTNLEGHYLHVYNPVVSVKWRVCRKKERVLVRSGNFVKIDITDMRQSYIAKDTVVACSKLVDPSLHLWDK